MEEYIKKSNKLRQDVQKVSLTDIHRIRKSVMT